MEMDIYERESYVHSISNLVTLKVFYDAGIDVTRFHNQNYFVDIQGYSMDPSVDILIAGLSSLFDEVKMLSYDELEQEEERYRGLLEDGTPETVIIIKDSLFTSLLASNFEKVFEKIVVSERKNVCYADVGFITIPEIKEIAVQIWFPGMLHEIVLALIAMRDKAMDLLKKLKSEEEKNGISNNNNRQIA